MDIRQLKGGELPRLENWLITEGYIFGYVYNHPKYPDNTGIRTSKILFLGNGIVITKNQPYILGETGRNLPTLDSKMIDTFS